MAYHLRTRLQRYVDQLKTKFAVSHSTDLELVIDDLTTLLDDDREVEAEKAAAEAEDRAIWRRETNQ
jgi:hypothetical protein